MVSILDYANAVRASLDTSPSPSPDITFHKVSNWQVISIHCPSSRPFKCCCCPSGTVFRFFIVYTSSLPVAAVRENKGAKNGWMLVYSWILKQLGSRKTSGVPSLEVLSTRPVAYSLAKWYAWYIVNRTRFFLVPCSDICLCLSLFTWSWQFDNKKHQPHPITYTWHKIRNQLLHAMACARVKPTWSSSIFPWIIFNTK